MSAKTALVLGGGFAGLSAAIHLALAGREVTLLEQAPSLGGKAGEHREHGYRFDTGPSVFTLPHVVEELFRAAGENLPFELRPLEPLCRYLYPSGRVWDVHQDVDKTTAQLSKQEADAYRALLQVARELFEASAPVFVYGQSPSPLGMMRYGLRHGLAARPFKTLENLIDASKPSSDLKRFFLRFATYFGADPYRAPAVLHNIAWAELGLGVSYPVGGIHAVVASLGALAARLGVTVCTGVEVERLETRGLRLDTVHTSAGAFQSDVVVSSLDVVRTHKLLGQRARVERLEPSLSGFVMLLGVTGETPRLAHHSISFSSDYGAEFRALAAGAFSDDPTLYFYVSSKLQPEDAPPGSENLFVMANAPALSQDKTLDEEAYAEHLLEVLERRGFSVTNRLAVRHILGPQHLSRLAHRGSIYGAAPHSLLSTLRPNPRVRGVSNLVLAGGSVYPGGGIPLALLSGKNAARLVSSLP